MHLLLVLDDRAEPLLAGGARARDDRRLRHGDVEAPPQQPIDERNRVRDVVLFPRAVPACNLDVHALVVPTRRHAQGRARDACADLVDARHLHLARGAHGVVGRDRRVVRDLLREVHDAESVGGGRGGEVELGHLRIGGLDGGGGSGGGLAVLEAA